MTFIFKKLHVFVIMKFKTSYSESFKECILYEIFLKHFYRRILNSYKNRKMYKINTGAFVSEENFKFMMFRINIYLRYFGHSSVTFMDI